MPEGRSHLPRQA